MSTRDEQQSAPTATDNRESVPEQPAPPPAPLRRRRPAEQAPGGAERPAAAGWESKRLERGALAPEADRRDEGRRHEPARVERVERPAQEAPAVAASGTLPPARRPITAHGAPGAGRTGQPGRTNASPATARPVLRARRPQQWSRRRAAMVVAGAPLALLLLFALWLLGPGRHRGVHGPFTVAESSQEQQLQPPPDRGAAGSQQAGTAPPTSDAPPAPEGPSASAVRRPGDPDNRTPILVELSKPERSQPLSALPPAPAVPPQAPPEPAPRPPARSAAAADQPSRPRQSPPPTLAAPPAEATPQAAAGGAGGTAEEMDAAAAPDVGASSGPGAAAGAASDEDESEPAPRPAEPGTAPLPRPASPGATPFLRPAEPGPGSYSPPARPRTEALPVPHRRAPAADTGADLNGSWELHNTIDSTRSSAYRGLRLTYSIDLRQEGSRIVGDGEKTAENGRTVPASQRTQIHVSGELVGRELRLVFTERGLWRGSGGNFRWRLSADGASLAGTFASNVADSRGSSEASRVP